MTTSAGVGSCASTTAAAIVASVPVTTRSSGSVAREITATGVSGARPDATRRALVSASVERPM